MDNCSDYYYIIEDDNISKYLVKIDSSNLKEMRCKIINDCSNIVHKKYKTIEEPNYFDTDHIRNYHSCKLGLKSFNDFFSQDVMEYFVEYDYYEHSKLVEILDNLLEGNMKYLDDLFDFNSTHNLVLNDDKLKLEVERLICNGEYDKIDSLVKTNINNSKRDLEDKKKMESLYVEKVKEYVNLELIDSIKVKDFENIRLFFEDCSLDKNTNKGLKRVLKLSDK